MQYNVLQSPPPLQYYTAPPFTASPQYCRFFSWLYIMTPFTAVLQYPPIFASPESGSMMGGGSTVMMVLFKTFTNIKGSWISV